MAPLSGAREIRVSLTDAYEHDLDAMLGEITAVTKLVVVCNPNNPTSTHIPIARIAEFVDAVPDHVCVILDEAYAEYQLHDDPEESVDLWRRSENLVVLRTFSKCYGLAGLRVGYALTSASLRGAFDAVRQPFSVNALAQAAGAEAIRHQDDVTQRVERTIVERVFVEEGVRELGLETPDSHANFSWIDLGDADEGEVVSALGDGGVVVRPGTPLGGPGHVRVSYGTRDQNERFIDGLAAALG
jgi:histidinol-phosphate aminotransferase